MSLKKDASGRRYIQVEVEVPGTPEEVWQAIATGPGISSWFVPAKIEERDGKPIAVKMEFGPGIAALGAMNFGGQSMVAPGFYLYGDETAGTVAHETPLWDAWIQKRFPMPTEA